MGGGSTTVAVTTEKGTKYCNLQGKFLGRCKEKEKGINDHDEDDGSRVCVRSLSLKKKRNSKEKKQE